MVHSTTWSAVDAVASATRPPCFFAAEFHTLLFSMPSYRIIKGVHPRCHVSHRRQAEHHGSAHALGYDTSAIAIIFLFVVATATTTAIMTIFSMQAVKSHMAAASAPPVGEQWCIAPP
jgi:hypothetical protein